VLRKKKEASQATINKHLEVSKNEHFIIINNKHLPMKNYTNYLLIATFLMCGTLLTAQSNWSIGKFKVKKIDFSLGYETDYVDGLDYNFFVNQMPVDQRGQLSSLQFQDGNFYSGICENPSINLGLTLVHPSLPNLEWRNNFSFKPNRVDAVTYRNNSDWTGEYASLSGSHTEYAVESAAIFRLPVFKFFNLYGGAGINTGITGNNTTCVFTSFDVTADNINFSNVDQLNADVMSGVYSEDGGYSECFDTGSQINQRAFLQAGAGLKFFQRVEVGFDLKYGIGYRADFGDSFDQTNIVSTNINLRYILK
jgi:hypothetical protein